MLLEREDQLGLMADVLVQVGSSGGKVVLIRGNAGMGKSALVNAFAASNDHRAHVLVGFCDDLLTPHPLGPFWDLARDEPAVSAALVDGDRLAVMRGLMDVMSRRLRPTVLVVEDTQWADEATIDVIKYLGRRIARTNGVLILTYRDSEVDFDHPLRQVFGELAPQDLVRVRLAPLSKSAIAALAADSEIDVDTVVSLAGGNPLFVTELVASGGSGVPSSVQDAVLSRAAKLSEQGRRLLDLVSVSPGATEGSVLERVLGPTTKPLNESLRQGLLEVKRDHVSFRHELTRRAIESALSVDDRRRLNQQILVQIEETDDLSRQVHHAREAEDVEAIIRFAPKAARAAVAVRSGTEAAAHFRLLEPYLDRIPIAERAAICHDWAWTEYDLDSGRALEILNMAIELHRMGADDERALAKDLTFATELNTRNGTPEVADSCLAEAIEILQSYPPSTDLAAAMGQKAYLAMARSEYQKAVEYADEAFVVAEDLGDGLTALLALNRKGTSAYLRGDKSGFRLVEEARRRAVRLGHQDEETRALVNMALLALCGHELELATDLSKRAIQSAIRDDSTLGERIAKAQYVDVLLEKGEWAEAEDLATEMLALAQDSQPAQAAQRALMWLAIRTGRGEATGMLDREWTNVSDPDDLAALYHAASGRAELMWLDDDIDTDVIPLLANIRDKSALIWSGFEGGGLAFRLWLLGDTAPPPDGTAKPYRLAMDGRATEAAELWEKRGMPYEQALALTLGDETDLLLALQILQRLGAEATVAKVRRLMKDRGIPIPRGPGRATTRHPAGLTARQSEVLQLLCDGLTDNEIADSLFVSPRTVHHHVSAILGRLGVSDRAEATAQALALGICTQ